MLRLIRAFCAGDCVVKAVTLAAVFVSASAFADAPPTVAVPASAEPAVVTEKTVVLSVLGADDGRATALTYTWRVVGSPVIQPVFNRNGNHAAQSVTVTFKAVGDYVFQVVIADRSGQTATSSVPVCVIQTPRSITLSPTHANLTTGESVAFTAVVCDQFTAPLTVQPETRFSVSGGGRVSPDGLFIAGPGRTGAHTLVAASCALRATARIVVHASANTAPTVAAPAAVSANPVTTTSAAISVLGADDAGEAALIYTWSAVGPAAVSFATNACNPAKNTTATFTQAGDYRLAVQVADAQGLTTQSMVTVAVVPPPVITPAGGSFSQPLTVTITPEVLSPLTNTPGWRTGVKYPGQGIESVEALSQDGATVAAMRGRTMAKSSYLFPGASLSPDSGPFPFYIWSLADLNGPANPFMIYQPSLFAGVTENTSWDGNSYDFYYGETGNRVFLLLQQHYSHSISLWSCAAGTRQGDTANQMLAEFPFTAVSALAGQATRMEFAGDQVRLLVGTTPLSGATTDTNGWVTYTGTNGSGRVTAPLGATRFWLTLAGGEKPGPREVVISDQPLVTTRYTYDDSPVTESSLVVTGKLTLTHDATIRARCYSAAGSSSAETVAVFTSTIPLLPAESFVSPAYMEILHATLDGSPALVSLSGLGGTTNGFALNNHRFILRYPLMVNEPTPVTLSRTGLPNLSTNIVWREIDLAASSLPDPMTIRTGDSLLFTAGVGETGTFHIAVMDGSNQVCQTREGVTGETIPVRFDQGGTFTVIASVDGISVGSLIVHVVYVDFDGPVACQVGYKREKGVAVYGPTDQVFFTAKDPALLEVSVKEVTSYGVRLYLKALGRGTPVVQARLGSATGPILAEQEVEEFTADSSAAQHLVVNGDTDTANSIVTMSPWIPNLNINFSMFAHYSTFAGGATAYTLNTSDQTAVNVNGAPAIELSVDPATGETQAVIRVDIEIPADEDNYCFSASFDQHSKYGTVAGNVFCNGKPCKFTIDELFIREGDLSGHTLTNTADNVNTNNHPSGHSHTITPVESTKFSVTARPTFNCKTDSSFPHWDPTVALTANAMASNKLSVTICKTTFSNVVIVLKVDIAPVETNVCWQMTNAVLSLTTNSYWAPEYSGAMTWSSTPIGLSGSGSGGTFTFNPSNSTPGEYTVKAWSSLLTNCFDTCTVRVIKVDLDIDSNYDGVIDDADDNIETSAGGSVAINSDDDDWDDNVDRDETSSIAGENDLQRITLKVEPALTTGTIKLETVYSGVGRIAIWEGSNKTTSVSLTNTWDLSTATVPSNLWIEGVSPSTNGARDVELRLSYTNGNFACTDTVAVTVCDLFYGAFDHAGQTHPGGDGTTEIEDFTNYVRSAGAVLRGSEYVLIRNSGSSFIIRIANTQDDYKAALHTQDSYIGLTAHANGGLGPAFDDPSTYSSITSFFNVGTAVAAIEYKAFHYLYPTFSVAATDIANGATNYSTTQLGVERFPNCTYINPPPGWPVLFDVPVGITFPTNSFKTGYEMMHLYIDDAQYDPCPNIEHVALLVTAGAADKPTLKYKKLFLNQCRSGRCYSDVMTNGVLFYNHDTGELPMFGTHRQETFLNAILLGKSNAATEADLNVGPDKEVYAHKVFP